MPMRGEAAARVEEGEGYRSVMMVMFLASQQKVHGDGDDDLMKMMMMIEGGREGVHFHFLCPRNNN